MTPESSIHAALFWLMLGSIVTFACLWLLGLYNEWRIEERNRLEDEAAERRIRQLDPLDDWTPPRWPIKRGGR